MPLPDEFLETLEPEYRENETLKRFNDPADVVKAYVEARSLLGNAIRVPGKDAPDTDRKEFLDSLQSRVPELMLKPNFEDPEQSAEFHKMMGWPEAPDKYEVPEELSLDESTTSGMLEILHQAKATPQQVKAVMKALDEGNRQKSEAEQAQIETAQKELKGKWGVAFDDRAAAAAKIKEEFGAYPNREFGDLTPKEIESLYKLHESMTGKGPQAHRQGDQQTQLMTPEEAKNQAAEIMRKVHDPESKLSHDEKMRLINKRIELLTKFAGFSGDINELRA